MAGMSRGVAVATLAGVVAALSFSCASGRTAAPAAERSAVPGTSGTHGQVLFVSENVGWVVASHSARHQTDIYKTADGGLHWALLSSLPEAAVQSIGVAESGLLLMPVDSDSHSDHLMFLADGGGWERRSLPTVPPNVSVSVQFLPDMKHGWLLRDNYGDLFQTADGGRTWKVVSSLRKFEDAGTSPPVFWNATDGSMFDQDGDNFVCLLTHDSGATWHTAGLPAIQAGEDLGITAKLMLSPGELTMFDATNGVLAIFLVDSADRSPDSPLRKFHYVTRTVDGGADWSAAKLVHLPAAGAPVFLDSQRWVLAGDRHLYFTRDAGLHWREAEGLNGGLWRGSGVIHVMQSNRNVAFLTFYERDIEWLDVSTDGGEHWKPVPLPDIREASA